MSSIMKKPLVSDLAVIKNNNKKKVIFIMGSTGCGKTKLSIDLAMHFPAEIINSDKIQVYKGLDIVTNKVTELDRKGVPHHLLGSIDDPNQDFTAQDFCTQALAAINRITSSPHCRAVPIVVGGSNSYIQSFVETLETESLKSSYDLCFIWVDVALPILYNRVSVRVDEMVHQGLVDEIREAFIPGIDYSRGVWRAIGVRELDAYFRAERDHLIDESQKDELLRMAIEETKINTCLLASRQREKIEILKGELGWNIHRVDATQVVGKNGEEAKNKWNKMVLEPSLKIVANFINNKQY